MAQHRVGRSARSMRWLPAVVAVVLGWGLVQPTQPVRAYATASTTGTWGDGSSRLSLPWTRGETWRLTGGAHSEVGKGRPWSALDFQPKSGEPGQVRAARAGRVSRPCPNLVRVQHEGGWETSYYHLRYIPVREGQWVERGTVLGWTSTKAGCGGYATGPHLHFSVLWKGSYVNIGGMAIGGWTSRDGDKQYLGCLVRSGMRECAPSGLIRNTGLIGSD